MTPLHRRSQSTRRGCMLAILVATVGAASLLAQHGHGSEGVGKAHMETSCAPAVQAQFDRALALLHNFWYARALTQFQEIQKADPECAMAYWGAAMTYNHPFWDDAIAGGRGRGVGVCATGAQSPVAERSRAHVSARCRRALQRCRRRHEAVTRRRPTASRWPPRTRSIRTTRPRCSTAFRSSATSGKGRRDSRCRAARSPSSNRSTRTTSSIPACCTTSFTPTTIRFTPKRV